jgi:hypothetical protein
VGRAGTASDIYGTKAQIANAEDVAAIGGIESNQSRQLALPATGALFTLPFIACARISDMDATRHG